MSSADHKAVFLSYASQDAEAAKRICDTLRASGVEVWFDAEGGLEHGDEWDAKIRRQIKECVLFLAVISANTQAREEGYFRIEWDLAAERARGIASGVAFILPIVIDDTREPDALVPDRFRSVQWTRLRGGEVTPEVKARFLKLWSHRTGALKHAQESEKVGGALRPDGFGESGHKAPPTKGRKLTLRIVATLGLLALAAGVFAWLARKSTPNHAPSAGTPPASAPVVAGPEFPRDPELAKAVRLVETLNSTMEDHTLAEDLAKAVRARKPTDPETVIVNAYVANRFILRGFDISEKRYAMARRLSERALLLAPDHPEALHALGMFLTFRNADRPRAVELIRRAVELQPDRARYYNSYVEALEDVDPKEALRVAEAAAARFPADAIIHYRLALTYAYVSGDLDAYERALDETIAIGPVATAVIRKASLLLVVHRDIAAAKAMLGRVPEGFRMNDRTIYARYVIASASGKTEDLDDALRALNALPGGFLSDFGLWPKRLLTGDLLAAKGQTDLARREYEGALADIARERARNPNAGLERPEKWLLLSLGREQEARAGASLTYQGARRPYSLRGAIPVWFDAVGTLLALGERDKALELLREAAKEDWSRRVLAGVFALDPHRAPWREDKEIRAILAPPAKVDPAATAPAKEDKSVAVLAFANLSSDKEQEYFSDGISEEVLNVLAKVPGLKVSARTSAFFFKGKQVPMAEIAQQLGVAYVVEGSVQRAGDRVKITAQLIKAADGFHVWSDSFTRDMRDIFAVQDEIAAKIATSLTDRLGMSLPVSAKTTPEAYTLYLQARAALAKRGVPNLREAVRMFDRVIAMDPDYLPARSGLAISLALIPAWSRSLALGENLDMINRARREARLVIERQPGNAEAWSALGYILSIFDWRWEEAAEAVTRSLALAPNDAEIVNFAGDYFRMVAANPQVVVTEKRAVELNPLQSVNHTDLSVCYISVGQYELAIEPGRRGISIAPELVENYEYLLRPYGLLKRFDEMRAVLVEARRVAPENSALFANMEILAAIYEGRDAEALRLLGQFQPHVEQGGYSPAEYGSHYLRLGQPEKALPWLLRGAKGHDLSLIDPTIVDLELIAANPVTRVVLEEPGLKELMALRARNARAAQIRK